MYNFIFLLHFFPVIQGRVGLDGPRGIEGDPGETVSQKITFHSPFPSQALPPATTF